MVAAGDGAAVHEERGAVDALRVHGLVAEDDRARDGVRAAVLDVGGVARLAGRAVAEAERRHVRLAAVLRKGRIKQRVRLVGGIAAVVADQERVTYVQDAVVERHRAGRLHTLPRLVRTRAHAQFVWHDKRRLVRGVAQRADRHLALVDVEASESPLRAVAVRRHAGFYGRVESKIL